MKKIIKKVTNDEIINGVFAIPEGVTEIGVGAFRDCSNLVSVSLPTSLKKIEEWAFENCSSLENIVIPEGVTKIGMFAFFGCENLKKISLPKDIILVDYVFYNCNLGLKFEYRN